MRWWIALGALALLVLVRLVFTLVFGKGPL